MSIEMQDITIRLTPPAASILLNHLFQEARYWPEFPEPLSEAGYLMQIRDDLKSELLAWGDR